MKVKELIKLLTEYKDQERPVVISTSEDIFAPLSLELAGEQEGYYKDVLVINAEVVKWGEEYD